MTHQVETSEDSKEDPFANNNHETDDISGEIQLLDDEGNFCRGIVSSLEGLFYSMTNLF